jgi:hypothetical protein
VIALLSVLNTFVDFAAISYSVCRTLLCLGLWDVAAFGRIAIIQGCSGAVALGIH